MRIVYYPDPVLMRPAESVDELPENLPEIVDEMRRVMKLERGIGLAAPQVGLSKRLILVNTSGELEDEEILLNPEITRLHGQKEWSEEGCLSFPGIYGSVLRHTHVAVNYHDVDGNPHTMEAEGLPARVLQHEIDHLDGVLFVTKMRPADKILAKQKLKALRDRYDALKT